MITLLLENNSYAQTECLRPSAPHITHARGRGRGEDRREERKKKRKEREMYIVCLALVRGHIKEDLLNDER